jgi:8-oxo-dGTP pyrophosphatase MutT (NUDIX family)
MADNTVKPWTVETQKYVWRDKWVNHRVDRCLTDRGNIVDPYHVFELSDWVNVVAITDDLQVLLIDEYRHGVGEVVRGLPSGTVDVSDHDAGQAMQRELMEETGFRADQMWPLVDGFANAARLSNKISSFLAIGCTATGNTHFDDGENIVIAPIDLPACLTMLHSGDLRMQVAHLLALFAAEAFIRRSDDVALAEIRAALV